MKKFISFETQLGESALDLTDKAKLSLYKKSQNSGYSIDILEEVYRRGYRCWTEAFGGNAEQFAFDRVNSFIAGGFAADLDEDLLDEKRGLWDNIHAKRARIKAGSGERMRKPGSEGAPTDAALKASQNEDTDPCWKNYKQVGMKMKGGKKVPNCVPVKEELKSVPSIDKISDKFNKPAATIKKAIKSGSKVEKEHTKDQKTAEKIATAHVNEFPDYYKKLDKAGLEEGLKDKVKQAAKVAGVVGTMAGPAYDVAYTASHPHDPAYATTAAMSYAAPSLKAMKVAANMLPSAIKIDQAGKGEDEFKRQAKMKKPVKEDAEKHSKNPDEPASRFIGSDELVDIYKKETPGQTIKRVVKEAAATYVPPTYQPPAEMQVQKSPQRQLRTNINVRDIAPRAERSGTGSARLSQGARTTSGFNTMKPTTTDVRRNISNRFNPSFSQQSTTPVKPSSVSGSTSYSQGGSLNKMGDKLTDMTRKMDKGFVPSNQMGQTLAKGFGKTAADVASKLGKIAGPVGVAAEVMKSTPLNAGENEKARQETLKSYNPYKASGRSVSDYEKQLKLDKPITNTPAPAANPKVDAPLPPTRPEYFSRGQAFSAAREKAGGGQGQFTYDNKPFQTNVPSEPYIPASKQKQTGIESESGKVKKIKEAVNEATYKGKKVPLNKPMAGDVKKSKVFVDPDGDGKAQKVNFGDKNMSIKKNQPARKKSYCARSGGQGNLTDKTSANYWSRRAWNCEETEVPGGGDE